LKILHVGKYFFPFTGGMENYIRDLMVALDKRLISGAALVHRHEWSLLSRRDSLALNGHRFSVVRAGTFLKLLFTPISPAFPWHLRSLIAEKEPDILHLHLPNPSSFWALALPSARRLPWIVHWHSDVVTAKQGWLMKLAYACYRPLENALLRRSSAIFVTSPDYRHSSKPLQPWLAKCRVVPLGLDTRRLSGGFAEKEFPLENATEARSDSKLCLKVLAIGRLTYYKGFRYLIEAIARVPAARLSLVGDGDQARGLRALVASLGLEGRVTFHGQLSDRHLAGLFAACDCLCLPSIERTEAFGMVLLEAMSFGKATVVSDVPGSGMGWIVDDGITGLKVPPADAEALASAFRELASDRDRLTQMGRAGRQKFERMFEIDQAVEGIVETYEAVLAEHSRAGEQRLKR